MNLDVILLGCFMISVAALWLLVQINRRHAKAVEVYIESTAHLHAIEKQKLDELKMIRLMEGQRARELQKLNANVRRTR